MQSNFQNLVTFAQEIERRESQKLDYIADTRKLKAYEDDGKVYLSILNGNEKIYPVTQHAQRQMAERVGIPAKYYDQMAEIPGLRAHNINEWFDNRPEKRMVRTLDSNARAFLSNKFRPFDNYTVVKSFLPVIRDMDLEVKSQILTEKKMYLQLLFPGLNAEVVGDVHAAGLVISNSEIGAGAIDVRQMLWNLTCTNGQTHGSVFRKNHVGRRIEEQEDNNYDIYSDETITADIRAFELKLRDTIQYALSEEKFIEQINKNKLAADDQIKIKDLKPTVEILTKNHTELNDSDQAVILDNMEQTKNFSRYGLANGITWLAQEIEEKDRGYELEKLGGKILGMSQNEWQKITN